MKKRGSALPVALLVAVIGAAVPAHATEYWSNEGLLKDFFSTSARVRLRACTLSAADADDIGKKLDGKLKQTTWNFRVGEDANQKRTGYALLDDEIGLH